MGAGSKEERLAAGWRCTDTVRLARQLLNWRLCRRFEDGRVLRFPITETEAYDGPEDRACHASRGLTPRTAVMFEPGGVWYVYLCYGVHWMLNLVTGPKDYPAAILLRGITVAEGPGRLTRHLAIERGLNGKNAAQASGLWLETGEPWPDKSIEALPRVGIGYAGEPWVSLPWRFKVNTRHLKNAKNHA